MTIWFSQAPTWLSLVVLVTVVNAVALGVMALARLWARAHGIASGPPVVNAWATVAGGLCSLLFAFTVAQLWNGWSAARTNVDAETAAIRSAARDLAPAQHPLLRAYVAQTISEWPQLCGGKEGAAAENALQLLEREAKPVSKEYGADLLTQLGTLEDGRNLRWRTASDAMPNELIVALVVLSLALLIVLSLALPESLLIHTALMVVVATSLGTLFWVVSVLQNPFCGVKGIGPQELLLIAKAHII